MCHVSCCLKCNVYYVCWTPATKLYKYSEYQNKGGSSLQPVEHQVTLSENVKNHVLFSRLRTQILPTHICIIFKKLQIYKTSVNFPVFASIFSFYSILLVILTSFLTNVSYRKSSCPSLVLFILNFDQHVTCLMSEKCQAMQKVQKMIF